MAHETGAQPNSQLKKDLLAMAATICRREVGQGLIQDEKGFRWPPAPGLTATPIELREVKVKGDITTGSFEVQSAVFSVGIIDQDEITEAVRRDRNYAVAEDDPWALDVLATFQREYSAHDHTVCYGGLQRQLEQARGPAVAPRVASFAVVDRRHSANLA